MSRVGVKPFFDISSQRDGLAEVVLSTGTTRLCFFFTERQECFMFFSTDKNCFVENIKENYYFFR